MMLPSASEISKRPANGSQPWVSRVAMLTDSVNATPEMPPQSTPSAICTVVRRADDSPPVINPLLTLEDMSATSSDISSLCGSP